MLIEVIKALLIAKTAHLGITRFLRYGVKGVKSDPKWRFLKFSRKVSICFVREANVNVNSGQ